MSKIEKEGFLSDEAEERKDHIYRKYEDFFDFARELNKLCMSLLVSLKIDWDDTHKLVIHTLFLRIVELFQSTYLLLERGMMPQSKVMTRAMLEVVFILIALQKDPKLLQVYQDQHDEAHRRSLKSALKFKNKDLKAAMKKHDVEKLYVEKKKT